MARNEKIRTEDVIEILDQRIKTTVGHPQLGVSPYEDYQSVLAKIASRSLSLEQKAALDATLTAPSSANPVVLKNDLMTYVPSLDLGDPRDSVATYGLLPVPFTLTPCKLTLGSSTVDVPPTASVIRGQQVTATGLLPANTYVIDILSPTRIVVSNPASMASTTGSLSFSPTVGELRGVINEGIIYRWDGSWQQFIRTGTMDHTQLVPTTLNADNAFQHISLTEKSDLLLKTHVHPNKIVLDGIQSVGSGYIITDDERLRLPTADQKAALIGTAGVPSASNPYVTTIDPRLDTARNPYITVGLPNSLATFTGDDFGPFERALLSLAIGASSEVKAIEVLPGSYDLKGVSLTWDRDECLLLEGFTAGSSILKTRKIHTEAITACIKALAPQTGRLIVRGLVFELNDLDTMGIFSQRANTLIEHCEFRSGDTEGERQTGITLLGANSVVRNCKFSGLLTYGIKVAAPRCRVESCSFDIPTSAIVFQSGSDYSIADHNFLTRGDIVVESSYVNVFNNILLDAVVTDTGTSTRILENQPEEKNQPFIGRRRTLGHEGTYADYRGATDAVFNIALADPYVTEIDVLEGDYTFASPVTVPVGKSIRGVRNGISIVIQGGFILSSNSRLENLNITGSVETTNGALGVAVIGCTFTSTTVVSLSLRSPLAAFIQGCVFGGDKGLYVENSENTRIISNTFDNSEALLSTVNGLNDHIKDNKFLSSTIPPVIQGVTLLVENNHFFSTPTKLLTTDSIWQGNWPHPRTNNDMGVDVLDLPFTSLEPVSEGVFRGEILGVGTLAFPESMDSLATTLALPLNGSFVDKNKPFTVTLHWTSMEDSGDVMWRVTATWRDSLNRVFGGFIQNAEISPRTKFATKDEDVVDILFDSPNYNIDTDPTHLSITVERVGSDPLDTLAGFAHLIEAYVTIPRD